MEKITQQFRAYTALLAVLSLVTRSQTCLHGRYGRYENWPSNNDWDELLSLVTGKHASAYGWSNTDSYAYNSIGNYPLGNLKYSASPWGTSGSSGASGSLHSSGNSGFGGSSFSKTSGSKLTTDQLRTALNSYFKDKPTSAYGGGTSDNGWIGESFVDSPGPGPPYNDDIRAPGPPYNDGALIRGPSGSPFHSPSSSGSPFAGNSHEHAPSYGNGPPPSYASGPPSSYGGGPPPSYETGSWPSSGGGPPASSGEHWALPQRGPPSTGPPHNNFLNSHEASGQFQSDYDTFGAYSKKRRQGRRRSHDTTRPSQYHKETNDKVSETRQPNYRRQRNNNLPSDASSPTTSRRPFKFPPYPGKGPRPSVNGRPRKQRRLGPPPISERRQLLKTSFGGYKVDHSRLRYG